MWVEVLLYPMTLIIKLAAVLKWMREGDGRFTMCVSHHRNMFFFNCTRKSCCPRTPLHSVGARFTPALERKHLRFLLLRALTLAITYFASPCLLWLKVMRRQAIWQCCFWNPNISEEVEQMPTSTVSVCFYRRVLEVLQISASTVDVNVLMIPKNL